MDGQCEGSSEMLFTQQIDNSMHGGDGDEEEFPDDCYGKLLSLTNDFPDIILSADKVTVGRQGSCTVALKNNPVKKRKKKKKFCCLCPILFTLWCG
jgi:hypothetical protein